MKKNFYFYHSSYFLPLAALVLTSLFLFQAAKTFARENVTDWYIQNFESEIKVNKDSSLDITEKITADCGACVGKHGIFRILPEDVKIGGRSVPSPVELISITDFSGRKIKYTETQNSADNTVTWKIGDPNVTVQGISNYQITYRVKNAIRFGNDQFDELYWNLTGNFWDLEIDKFHGTIIFPEEISRGERTMNYYTGFLGEKRQDLASYRWSVPNILEFDSTKTLGLRQGITVSVTFPKNIFTPYTPTFWEKYGKFFPLFIPVAVFFICFYLWWKYGKDPRVGKTVIAEYEIPDNLSPIETGMLMSNGNLKNEFITAEIIALATKRMISIKEINEKILFFKSKDYEISKTGNADLEKALSIPEQAIVQKIFESGNTVKLSELKNKFYTALKDIKKKAINLLADKNLIAQSGITLRTIFQVTGGIMAVFSFLGANISEFLPTGLFISGLIAIAFGYFMPKRTPAGAELNWKIKGFKLFMETVDKDRAAFYEKENIFEKFLPYAIVFGITDIWIKKMKEIYGENYYANYAPAWYAGNVAAFDADSFATAIDNLSSDIAANTSAPSGSGGGGGAGGGGGGGGGGGW